MKLKELISGFIADVQNRILEKDLEDFHFFLDEDTETEMFYIYHNLHALEVCADFEEYVGMKMYEHFYAKGFYNICFSHNYDFEQEIIKSIKVLEVLRTEVKPRDLDAKTTYGWRASFSNEPMRPFKPAKKEKEKKLWVFKANPKRATDFSRFVDGKGWAS